MENERKEHHEGKRIQKQGGETMAPYLHDPWSCYEDDDGYCGTDDAVDEGCCCCCC